MRIKKLTYQNPTMKAAFKQAESKAKFDEARKNGQDKDIAESKDEVNNQSEANDET